MGTGLYGGPKAVNIRYDIVHRKGKNKEGSLHIINKDDVINCGNEVKRLIAHIEI